MRLCQYLLALVLAAHFSIRPAWTQERTVTVGAPAEPLIQLVEHLAPAFQAKTGVVVKSVTTVAGASLPGRGADALLLPSRIGPGPPTSGAMEHRLVFFGDSVLVGSRADRARIRGLRDIKSALRWIASARGTYVSSSPELGVRELELALWDSIGVNVRARSTWYIEATGDEASVLKQAAALGAYVLVERATWAGQRDRRGLEVLAAGDPALRTEYTSYLVRPDSRDARAWHDWLSSEQAQAAIAGWQLNGVQVFTPAGAQGRDAEATPPRT